MSILADLRTPFYPHRAGQLELPTPLPMNDLHVTGRIAHVYLLAGLPQRNELCATETVRPLEPRPRSTRREIVAGRGRRLCTQDIGGAAVTPAKCTSLVGRQRHETGSPFAQLSRKCYRQHLSMRPRDGLRQRPSSRVSVHGYLLSADTRSRSCRGIPPAADAQVVRQRP